MKHWILLAACAAGLSLHAQEVTVASSQELINTKPEHAWTRALGHDATGYYLLREHGPVSDRKVMVEKYSPAFQPVFVTDVGASTGHFNEFTMHRLTEWNNGRVLIFLEGWSKEKSENSFSVKALNEDGTFPEEATLLETEPAPGQMKSANYRVAFSPDGAYMAVLTEKPFVKGEKEEQRVQVFSTKDWSSVWKREITLDNEADRYPNNDMVVSNAGTVFLYKDIKISMKEHLYELYTYNTSLADKQVLDLKTYFPTHHKLQVTPEGGLLIGGMLATAGTSATNWQATWQLKTDAGGKILTDRVEPLGAPLLGTILSPGQAAKEGARLDDFVLKDILLKSDGGMLLLAENYRSASTPVGTATPPVYDYELTFGGIMIVSMDAEGNRAWHQYYDKQQRMKTRDPKAHFCSFTYQLKNDNLYLTWNFTDLRNDFPVHNFRYWVDRSGAKINIDNLYGKECHFPTLLTVVNPDGSLQYTDRTFNALPLTEIQKPNAFPMATDPNLFFTTADGIVVVSRMPGVDAKRYKFNTIRY